MPLQEAGDAGRPIVTSRPDSTSAQEFRQLAEAVFHAASLADKLGQPT
jgi:MinD-like ATPase involved in chromosome partitioning or flagellar assembly